MMLSEASGFSTGVGVCVAVYGECMGVGGATRLHGGHVARGWPRVVHRPCVAWWLKSGPTPKCQSADSRETSWSAIAS